MLRTLLSAAIFGVFLTNPASAQPQQLRAAEPQDALAGVRNVVQSAIDRGRIAGGVVHVSQNGNPLLVEAFGKADVDRPMTTDAVFRIASMTKPVTSVAVMMLAEEGRLRLDDPLARHLPEFGDLRVVDAESGKLVAPNRAVTIRDLLSHTSGIPYPFMAPESAKADYTAAALADGLNPRDPSLAENTRKLASLPLSHQPGAAFTYGMNTDVLGRVIEVASGKPLDQFFAERIFGPLKMPDTGFFVSSGKHSRLAALYRPVAGANPARVEKITADPERTGEVVYSAGRVANPPKYLSGGAGLVSTAADYARFLTMLLRDGALDGVRLLTPESVRAMTTNQIGPLSCAYPIHGEKFGFGFGITAKASGAAPVGTFSWGGIYHTFFWVDPQNEVVAVLMTQLYPWGDSTLWADFQEAVYGAISRGADKAETLIAQLQATQTPPAPESGFQSLFDGRALGKWEGDPAFWRVAGGAIVGETTADKQPADAKNTFLIYRGGEFADFELRFRYKVEGFNSGMQYRSVDRGQFHVDGLQADFEARWHEDPARGGTLDKFSGMFFEENGRMFMAQRGEAVIVRSNPADPKKPRIEKIARLGDPQELEKSIHRDDWNDYIIIANGNVFTHIINGQVMTLAIDEDDLNFRKSGILALQLHSGKPMRIEVKDIRIREITKRSS